MHDRVGGAGTLADPSGAVRLTIPSGWSVSDDVGAATCVAPSGRVDITGRVGAAQIRIEGVRGGTLVPRVSASGLPPDIATAAQGLVRDALAGDPTSVLLDACWLRPRTDAGRAEAIRIDLAHHDMTTAMLTTTIFVDTGQGMVRVGASVPAAHHRVIGGVVEQALTSIDITGTPTLSDADRPILYRSAFDAGSWDLRGYRPSPVTIDAVTLDVFQRGSHKIAPRWRAPALSAGLIEANGTATAVGHYVRRATSRPDRRIVLQVWQVPTSPLAQISIDVLDGHAVLRSGRPLHVQAAGPGAASTGAQTWLEVQDAAAAPARVAAWLGMGTAEPEKSFPLPSAHKAWAHVARAMAPGQPVLRHEVQFHPRLETGTQVWARLVALLS